MKWMKLIRVIKSDLTLVNLLRIPFLAVLLFVCVIQIRDSIEEIAEQPTVSAVSLENLLRIRYPTITACHRLPFTQIDMAKLNATYGVSWQLATVLAAGSGVLPQPNWCHRNYLVPLVRDSNPVLNWSSLAQEYASLRSKLKMTDSQLIRHVYSDFVYGCEKNFDDANYYPPVKNPQPPRISGELGCGGGFMSKVWSVEYGLCWVVNTTEIPATTSLTVFPTVPELMPTPDYSTEEPDYYDKYVKACASSLHLFFSDGVVARQRSLIEAYLYNYENYDVSLSIVTSLKNCQDPHAWSSKYLPRMFAPYSYSVQNCEADIMIENYTDTLGCIPAMLENPHNLKTCDPVVLAKMYIDTELHELPFPAPPNLETVARGCPQPCGKRHSYTFSKRRGASSNRRFHLALDFSSFDLWQSVEKVQNSPESYFGQIGGILGLWLGFSMFSLYEYSVSIYRTYALLRDKKRTVKQAGTLEGGLNAAMVALVCTAFGHEVIFDRELSSSDKKKSMPLMKARRSSMP